MIGFWLNELYSGFGWMNELLIQPFFRLDKDSLETSFSAGAEFFYSAIFQRFIIKDGLLEPCPDWLQLRIRNEIDFQLQVFWISFTFVGCFILNDYLLLGCDWSSIAFVL